MKNQPIQKKKKIRPYINIREEKSPPAPNLNGKHIFWQENYLAQERYALTLWRLVPASWSYIRYRYFLFFFAFLVAKTTHCYTVALMNGVFKKFLSWLFPCIIPLQYIGHKGALKEWTIPSAILELPHLGVHLSLGHNCGSGFLPAFLPFFFLMPARNVCKYLGHLKGNSFDP